MSKLRIVMGVLLWVLLVPTVFAVAEDKASVSNVIRAETTVSNVIRAETTRSLDDVKKALEAAAKEKGYGVAAVHDLPAMMAKRGVEFNAQVLVFEVCHPEQAKAVLSERMEAATLLPCRISVWVESGKVIVATLKPTVLLATLGNADRLVENAAQVEKDLAAIIQAATGADLP